MKEYPVFKYAEWIKENNNYYLEHENLLDGDWFIKTLPPNLQDIMIKVNEQDWSYGIEYDQNLEILFSEMNYYLSVFRNEYNTIEYLKGFLSFSYNCGYEETFGGENE